MKAPIVIAAGGTGGHFFPAEAVATILKEHGYPLVLMTDKRNTHYQDSVFRDFPCYILPGSGIAGKGFFSKIKGGVSLLYGALKARRLIKKIRPAAIVGFGGYPSIPPLVGARFISRRRRPVLIIHEGNAVLGKANALAARFATVIATSFEHVAHIPEGAKVHLTGMPVRAGIEALAPEVHNMHRYQPPEQNGDDPIHILVWGGSLGASIFSHVVPDALARLPFFLRERLQVIQQVPPQDMGRVHACYAQAGITASLCTFIHDVPDTLSKAHLVIGRAGGSSVAELTMSGRPSILVPLPIAASDEQGANAQALESKGAAWMFRQSDFTIDALHETLETLFTRPVFLVQAAVAARRMQHRHAAEKLADLVESVVQH